MKWLKFNMNKAPHEILRTYFFPNMNFNMPQPSMM